ncbi:TonB-dependent receptor [Chitinophaga horti]|uniref:TonB-dependent receptor n=1 Tax=Chitinophaga horti TaxID=2920382 RepID=A0ABY6JCD7_9BACT|nr:TonB-dependent receptor [Chitinophaga horti]UYQ95874.1 TonB-dependent receptor [Chitinophaga horti]
MNLPGLFKRCGFILLLLSLATTFSVAAHPATDAQSVTDAPVRLNLRNSSLKLAFKEIEQQTQFRFVYKDSPYFEALGLDLQIAGNLNTVLDELARRKQLKFEEEGKNIVVYHKPVQAQGRITGVIKDKDNNPVPGATVKIAALNKGVVSDAEGRFVLPAPAGTYTLEISCMSFQAQKMTGVVLAGDQTLNIEVLLAASSSALTEVVVVGYGTQSRKLLSGSVSTVNREAFNRGGLNSPAQLLQGKVAGLTVSRSGDPNAAPSISLRGPSTLRTGAAQEPFYVIDGIPGADFKLIAPDDIESIDVLKDASATAIYGTRAANGVIIITTRRGAKGKTVVTYSGYAGVDQATGLLEMMDASERAAYLAKMGKSAKPADEQGADTDWQEEVTRTGFVQNHNVNLSGGTEQTMYSASVNYFQHKGILKGSDLSRIIGRLNLSQKALNDHLTLGLTLSNSSSVAAKSPDQDLILYNAQRYVPTVSVKNASGEFNEDLTRQLYYNPVSLQEKAKEELKTNVFLLNASAQVKLPFDLKYNLSVSTQKEIANRGQYFNSDYTLKLGLNGEAYRSSYENTRNMLESYFTYDKRLQSHNIKLLAGYSWQQDVNGDGFQANNRNFPSDDLGYSNIGLGSPVGNFRTDWGTNIYEKLRLISFYGRANYDYKGKYIAQLSLRRDGSSAFGKNNRWGTFPAGSVAWRITEEDFMRGQHLFDDLKLRVGYGVTGNSLGFNPLISKIRYGAAGTFYYNGNFTTAVFATQNANPDLRWEKTAMVNLAVDASLLKGRLNITAEYYDKKTTDLIWEYTVSTVQYFVNRYTANVGDISNKGYELTVDATPVVNKNFTWKTSLNIAHNRNKLESLSNSSFSSDSIPQGFPNGQGQSNLPVQLLKAGYPVGQFFTFRYAGKDANGVSQFYSKKGGVTTDPVDHQDYFYAGNAQPKLLLGWSNSFTYHNFDLNIFLRGSFGNKVFNSTLASLNHPNEAENYNMPVSLSDESPEDGNAFRQSDRYIEDASYLRLDNASLGYTFRNVRGLSNFRLYVTGNNIAVLTKYKGIDPEVNLGGLTPGIDNRNYYPRTRTLMLGLNVTF